MICNVCGRTINGDGQYCSVCGVELSMKILNTVPDKYFNDVNK